MLFVNFGHASTSTQGIDAAEVTRVDVPAGMIAMGDPLAIHRAALDLCRQAAPALAEAARNGDGVYVALPGASALAVAVALGLQGLLGHVPPIILAVKLPTGQFVYDFGAAGLDTQNTRDAARTMRAEFGL